MCSVLPTAVFLPCDENVVLVEIRMSTGLLVDLRRISVVEQNGKERGFLEFNAGNRRSVIPAENLFEWSFSTFIRESVVVP